MIITIEQYEDYIVKGAIINRVLYGGDHLIEVLDYPFDYTMMDGRIFKRFKYKSISSDYEGEYFVSDLFRGDRVEILNPDIVGPNVFRISQEEFEV